jgi:hypothetical protein
MIAPRHFLRITNAVTTLFSNRFAHHRERSNAQQENTPLGEPMSVYSAAKVKPAALEQPVALPALLVLPVDT